MWRVGITPQQVTGAACLRSGCHIGVKLRRQPPSLFFDANAQPMRMPEVLGEAERASLYDGD